VPIPVLANEVNSFELTNIRKPARTFFPRRAGLRGSKSLWFRQSPDGCNSTALGLNDHADVVGFCYQNQESNAFLYRYYDDTIKDIGSLGGQATTATAINNAEQIVGYSTDSNNNVLAFLYSKTRASLR
jgi:probable HAF family extracellular repeat protein